MNIQLYDYQEVAHDKVIKALRKFGRALLVMATGLGKTIVSAKIVEFFLLTNKKSRILILCHDTGILEQTFKKYQQLFGTEYTCARFYGKNKNWNADKHTFVFATFQSKPHLFFDTNHFDYIIVDEGHHAKAETYFEVLNYFTPQWKLGMTATPDREDDEDIRLIFGDEVVNHSLAEGIAKGWLTYPDYKVLDDGLDNDVIQQLVQEVLVEEKRITMAQLNELLFINMRTEKQCERILSYTNTGKKAIVFCKNINHLNHVMKMLPNSVAVHSEQSTKLNDDAMEMYVAGLARHIVVVDKFNEGIDLPDTDVLAFLRPTNSQRIWLQQLGRGLRKFFGKDKVTILDFVGNVERLKEVFSLSIEIGKFGTTVKGFDGSLLLDSPLHIEGSSFMFDFSEKMVNLLSVLEYVEKFELYSYEEAKEAVEKLGITSRPVYNKRYKEDPKLPSNPQNFYKDRGWTGAYEFFGKEKKDYYTYEEAKKVVAKLGIKKHPDYQKRFREDPKLPSNPDLIYQDKGWTNWPNFCGKEKKDFYTYEEAKKVVAKLGITNFKAYHKRYKEDSRLSSKPEYTYKDKGWIDWSSFFGKDKKNFYTYEEAKKVVAKLGITDNLVYGKRYKEDSRLPSNPKYTYKDKGWIDWYEFFGKKKE